MTITGFLTYTLALGIAAAIPGPGVIALVVAGWEYGYDAYKLREVSVNSPVGVPVWQLKLLIPFGAGLLALQGFAEVLRCTLCLREGRWPARLHDVEELEKALAEKHASQMTEA